ncbi:hypothetical protein GTZ96_000505 [Flavobacterium sp. BBQ-18]|nr:hypothetical protein [Flavobacterium undicola]MBA0882173.1 hypothetical protein [Flavobacterium undicola]
MERTKANAYTWKTKRWSFGLIKKRVFNVVWVDESNGIGVENGETNISVKYNGNSIAIRKK